MEELQKINHSFLVDMRSIILEARNNAVRGVEYTRLMMYWHLGERFFIAGFNVQPYCYKI